MKMCAQIWPRLLKGYMMTPCPALMVRMHHQTPYYSTQSTNLEKKKHSTLVGPLSDIRIIDLTRILAGPFATMVLGDLGAEVIKVERPDKGDETRSWGPPFVGKESCYFLSVNRNKKSIGVDLKHPDGVSLMHDLVKHSDVLIENFIPGALDRLGLGYDELKLVAPHLVYCSISGYGASGPYQNRPGYDVMAAAIGGLLGVTGPEDGEPCKVGVAMTDLATGLYAHGAIMAALLDRQKTGSGQKIDCSLLSTQVSCMVNLASNFLNGGQEAKKWGTGHESIVPYQAFPTSDGSLIIGALSNDQFSALCHVLGLKSLLKDERYFTNALRVKNRDTLTNTLRSTFQQKSTEEWLSIFEGCSFPYAPINTLSQTFSDPQVIHNQMEQVVEHPGIGKIKQVAPAVLFSSSQNRIRAAPPVLGQHTQYVLSEILQYSEERIQDLKRQHVICDAC
ncbi:succinate--hydroxymethylglutarate CoA-transferase-like [Homarus americanus]|uniref:Succinate--hydroxymethylglutarate CoA-transferase-like n=1 Tax=Homarus americanus TaxID=6706 RepID=A0A8J5J4K7_HOMAM|nr:succinate--hydroxymethylglutarate CoA-transferase-like [Homarus americanus]XP_042209966.1 succinate--hydroxymethylglutarate CoA-transferase-like [Homarus americanus]XP_042209967.1 succinate--hydroxymethylglutarate CoA-transferase-like [Homarus americanus]KAG7153286.1 Succinate--hydroxymethylglutarate CoA-transferase-like [Homarus americanus]